MTSPTIAPDTGTVRTDSANGIATISFHHPKGNSLPSAQLARLAQAVDAAAADDGARVVVLRSEGGGPFCAGASFAELQSISARGDREAGREFFMGFARLNLAMKRCPKMIVARVHGKAVGGGVGVVAAADYPIAVRSASVRLSELAVGIGPFVVGPAIERKIGLGAFAAMAADADWRDAAWAERHGLYAQLHDDAGAMDAAVAAAAERLASSNPEAMRKLKAVFWEGTDDWDRLLAERAEMSGTLVLSAFTRNAISAFGAGAR